MTAPRFAVSRRAASAALALALARCSLLAGPAPKLYRVTPKSVYPADLPHISVQLLVDLPLAPAGLDTVRIALSRSPVSIDYFADSEWTDRASTLIQTALVESFENSKSVTAIDRESIGLRADVILKTEIRHFEAVYQAGDAPPTIWVAINARLVRLPDRQIVAQASFERHQAASANGMIPIVTAFDEALGGVMKDIVVWTATNPALSKGRR